MQLWLELDLNLIIVLKHSAFLPENDKNEWLIFNINFDCRSNNVFFQVPLCWAFPYVRSAFAAFFTFSSCFWEDSFGRRRGRKKKAKKEILDRCNLWIKLFPFPFCLCVWFWPCQWPSRSGKVGRAFTANAAQNECNRNHDPKTMIKAKARKSVQEKYNQSHPL